MVSHLCGRLKNSTHEEPEMNFKCEILSSFFSGGCVKLQIICCWTLPDLWPDDCAPRQRSGLLTPLLQKHQQSQKRHLKKFF